jgi:hypothetical protein
VRIQTTEYGITYSSRKSIKKVFSSDKKREYTADVWGAVAEKLSDLIPTGYTIYGEIVGYTIGGKGIQSAPGGKVYDYGCAPGEHKFLVYRITSITVDGKVLELNWMQKKEFCSKYGLNMVCELYYGKARELFPFDDTMTIENWQNGLLTYLEKRWVNDQYCTVCKNQVPAEGIVIGIDHLETSEAYKLKNWFFLQQESKLLDSGEADIETIESEDQPEVYENS